MKKFLKSVALCAMLMAQASPMLSQVNARDVIAMAKAEGNDPVGAPDLIRSMAALNSFAASTKAPDSARSTLTAKSPGYVAVESFPIMLHFSLITPTDGNAPVDPSIANVTTALKELFRYPNYRLLDDAVVAVDFPGQGRGDLVQTSLRMLGNGGTYSLNVAIDTANNNSVRMRVSLRQDLPSASTVLLSTQVSVPYNQTVVIGSTHGSVGGPVGGAATVGRGGRGGSNPVSALQALQEQMNTTGRGVPAAARGGRGGAAAGGSVPVLQQQLNAAATGASGQVVQGATGGRGGGRGGNATQAAPPQGVVAQGGNGRAVVANGQAQGAVRSMQQIQAERSSASVSSVVLPLILVVRPSIRQ